MTLNLLKLQQLSTARLWPQNVFFKPSLRKYKFLTLTALKKLESTAKHDFLLHFKTCIHVRVDNWIFLFLLLLAVRGTTTGGFYFDKKILSDSFLDFISKIKTPKAGKIRNIMNSIQIGCIVSYLTDLLGEILTTPFNSILIADVSSLAQQNFFHIDFFRLTINRIRNEMPISDTEANLWQL